MKIAVITCYFEPDYVRARSLRAALLSIPNIKMAVVKNTHKGMMRYPEIIWKIWKVKRTQKPDAYLLTFRGQEILPFVLFLAGKKPVIFDEFIVPIAYATGEKHKRSFAITIKHSLARISEPLYKRWLRRCAGILADTKAHAELSARVSHMNLRKYVAVPVGTDDALFTPNLGVNRAPLFQVFYYSTGMQPLHGIPTVLQAAELLKDTKGIEFLIVGGKKPLADAVAIARQLGANVRYDKWIPFDDLVTTIQSSGLCLGGPFGNTPQAQHVITGKTYQFLACQVPVLIGASEATNEYFNDRNNALVVPQANAAALAAAIKWAYLHPVELKQVAANGRKLYEKNFSTKAIASVLEPLLSSL